jgi:RNA polymerase sigma-70 factor (ECF subfamily)
MREDSQETREIIQRAVQGDAHGWADLVGRYRDRLQRMVAVRIDRRMQQRVNPSDIVQEAYLEAAEHLAKYVQDPQMPFFLWLRGITGNKLLEIHRHHLGAKMRDAAREVAIEGGASMPTTAAGLAAVLVSDATRPDEAALRQEMRRRLEEALDALEPLDREVLSLRHFEQLSNGETAEILGLDISAASKRYVRALKRLKSVLAFRDDESPSR